jgi:hypothetical protein
MYQKAKQFYTTINWAWDTFGNQSQRKLKIKSDKKLIVFGPKLKCGFTIVLYTEVEISFIFVSQKSILSV